MFNILIFLIIMKPFLTTAFKCIVTNQINSLMKLKTLLRMPQSLFVPTSYARTTSFLFFLRCGGEGEIHTLAYTLLKIQPNDRANVRVEQDSGELDAFVTYTLCYINREIQYSE